jgi:hypothetical protein
MKRLLAYSSLWIIATSAAIGTAAAAPAASLPRYSGAVERELQSMGRHPSCELEARERYHCSFEAATTSVGHAPAMHAVYSDQTDTVYLYAERYLTLPSDHARTPAVLRRLMELNWDLLAGKFEWNPRSGEVRLSAVLSTDSNFDRRAFRSLVHALEVTCARYDRELRALSANP